MLIVDHQQGLAAPSGLSTSFSASHSLSCLPSQSARAQLPLLVTQRRIERIEGQSSISRMQWLTYRLHDWIPNDFLAV